MSGFYNLSRRGENEVAIESQIVGPSPRPHLLILAGIHGDEVEPMIAVKRLIQLMRRVHVMCGRVTLIPVATPSARRQRQRVGKDGRDLARTFPGRREGSITERVAAKLTDLINSADFLIDLHTGGENYRLWPLAGFMIHERQAVLDQQRRMARAFNLPVVWGSDPALQGRSLSVARDAVVPAIYVEYLGTPQYCRAAVDAMVKGCLHVAAMFKMIEHTPSPGRVRYWAEDAEAGARHLQTSHPAPSAGTFVPLVELGQSVGAGERLGILR